ncbi:MAG: protein-S-isoprenylcysteine O-methyltransferase [Planctomycetota bacterium]
MPDRTFDWLYLGGLLVAIVVRKIGERRSGHRANLRGTPLVELICLLGWGVAASVLPVLHLFTGVLAFADYSGPVPPVVGIAGCVLFALAIWLLHRSHADLGRHWSAKIELQADHSLVTSGVYRRMRHPMYTAHLLWCVAQAMLIANAVAGLTALALMTGMLITRIPREEAMMLGEFGEAWRYYQSRTGRLTPWL